ncbi:MAG: hypothetical protein WBH73_08720 [Arcanobacterium sp.]
MEPITPEINKWTHPRTGEVRSYINNWFELLGGEVNYYNSGNVSSCYLGSTKISNSRVGEVKRAKFWIDETGQLHVERWSERTGMTANEAQQRIQTILDAD